LFKHTGEERGGGGTREMVGCREETCDGVSKGFMERFLFDTKNNS